MHKHVYEPDGPVLKCHCGVMADPYPNHHSYRLFTINGPAKIDEGICDIVQEMLSEQIPVFSSCQGGCLITPDLDDSIVGLAEAYHNAVESNTYTHGYFTIRGNYKRRASKVVGGYVKIEEAEYNPVGNFTRIVFHASAPCPECLRDAIAILDK